MVSRLSYHDDYFTKMLAHGSSSVYIWILNEDNMPPVSPSGIVIPVLEPATTDVSDKSKQNDAAIVPRFQKCGTIIIAFLTSY